jgi:Restriction endonuclease
VAKLPMPDVPPGNLRALVLELHELHARAGWPSTRDMARGRDFSHTAVHDLFTKTTAEAPRLTVLLDVVDTLCRSARRINDVDAMLDRFETLWKAAHAEPLARPPAPRARPQPERPGASTDPEPTPYVREYDFAAIHLDERDAPPFSVTDVTQPLDLMKVTPTEFEQFVRKLFEASGFDSWATAPSTGVSAVMTIHAPLMGGVTVLSAKKYKTVVGPNHIRELVGAMEETRAGRGVLVTTSWFSRRCWTMARENGRVELIDGPQLRHLARERLGIDVLVAPQPESSGTG